MKFLLTFATCSAQAWALSSISLPASTWATWQGIDRAFFFGDSYTTTGFNDTLTQPSASSPLGNPTYPGYTSSNGPNWVDYLTVQFNKTLLQTVNLAYGGATVDSALVAPYLPTVLSVQEQVHDEFLPNYGKPRNKNFWWEPASTLFATFIGINDVGNSYANANRSAVYPLIFSEYRSLMEDIYNAGARNFLFVNVPPVNRSPLTKAQGPSAQRNEKSVITAWNRNVTRLAWNLKSEHEDASVFVFDANTLWNQVLDNPCCYKETCAYKNTTNYCVAYENGTPTPTSFNASCGIPVDNYFWLNSLHPTYRMHEVFAMEVSRQLNN